MSHSKSTRILAWMTLAALAVQTLAGCAPSPAARMGVAQSQAKRLTAPEVPEGELAELSAGNRAFAADFYRSVSDQPGNQFFSPYSLSLALAMAYAGARGETERQMAEVMHYTLPQDRLHPAFNALDLAGRPAQTSSEDEPQPFRLSIANATWGQQGYEFLPAYLDLLAAHYGAGMHLVDFNQSPEPARKLINDWVSEETEERIQDLLPEGSVDQDTRLVLTNAIYFKADWLHPFEKSRTEEAPFYLLEGGEVQAPLMSMDQNASLPYARGDGYQAVALPYAGNQVSMLILLPDEGTFNEFEAGLDSEKLDAIQASLQDNLVDLRLPKFQYESQYQLADVLKEMGMQQAFEAGQADFSGMDGTQNLYISDVIHKAFVAVDEKGTEAAAATAVIVAAGSAMVETEVIELRVDRPFIFLIRDDLSGSILFAGRVLNPVG